MGIKMHLFLFINYIGGVSQKKKKIIQAVLLLKKKIYIGGSLVIFVKGIFIINLKKIIWEKIDWNLWYFYSRDL